MRFNVLKDVEKAIEDSNSSLTFQDIKQESGHLGQDVRSSLKELLKNGSGIYVSKVEEGEKYYDKK